MTSYAIGENTATINHGNSLAPVDLMNGYVQVNYVPIGDRRFTICHNYYYWEPTLVQYTDYKKTYFDEGSDANGNWIALPSSQAIYTLNCQHIRSNLDTYLISWNGVSWVPVELPLMGIEIYFTANPNAPIDSHCGYSGCMAIGDIRTQFDGVINNPTATSREFIGIADMDLPSVLLLDNFDTYIPKIRYGIYSNGNAVKLVVNGVVVRTGKVHNLAKAKYCNIYNQTYPLSGATLSAISKGIHKCTVYGDWINDTDVAEYLNLAIEISTYDCKYLNLRQGTHDHAYDSYQIELAGVITGNFHNQFPRLIIS